MSWPHCITAHYHVCQLFSPEQMAAEDIFERIFLNENVRILIKISQKFIF